MHAATIYTPHHIVIQFWVSSFCFFALLQKLLQFSETFTNDSFLFHYFFVVVVARFSILYSNTKRILCVKVLNAQCMYFCNVCTCTFPSLLCYMLFNFIILLWVLVVVCSTWTLHTYLSLLRVSAMLQSPTNKSNDKITSKRQQERMKEKRANEHEYPTNMLILRILFLLVFVFAYMATSSNYMSPEGEQRRAISHRYEYIHNFIMNVCLLNAYSALMYT